MKGVYTTKEAAGKTGISQRMVQAHIESHVELRRMCSRIGRDWLMGDDAIQWLRNRRSPGRPQKPEKQEKQGNTIQMTGKKINKKSLKKT